MLPLQLDEAKTYIWSLEPSVPTRPPVLMLHGIQSHPEWFVGSVEALVGAGHPVYQFTRRGSGTNVDDRGHVRSMKQLMDDLDRAVEFVLARTGAGALEILGVSWGGKYAVGYVLDTSRASKVVGLTLVAPGICTRVGVGAATKLLVGLCSLVAPRHKVKIPLSDPALFTDTPQRREYIRNDPHRLIHASARFLLLSRQLDWRLRRAAAGAIDLPTTLILAETDRIIHNDRTESLLRKLVGEKLRVLHLPGAHTLEFEPDPTPLYEACRQSVDRS